MSQGFSSYKYIIKQIRVEGNNGFTISV